MPQLIENIDALARQKQRDVLFICFPRNAQDRKANADTGPDAHGIRKTIIAWLEAHGMDWAPCGPIADPDTMPAYDGRIYVDVPFDLQDPIYQTLQDFLEKPDGSMAHAGADFCYLPLEAAMKNAHHDAPGFWEKWADDL